jgi:hypothetical protein
VKGRRQGKNIIEILNTVTGKGVVAYVGVESGVRG